MNKEDIIRMAKEAGFAVEDGGVYTPDAYGPGDVTQLVKRFAALVAAAERDRFVTALKAALAEPPTEDSSAVETVQGPLIGRAATDVPVPVYVLKKAEPVQEHGMTTLRTAAQQALEALKIMQPEVQMGEGDAAITALRAALAEEALQRLTDVSQEIEAALAEPVAWLHTDPDKPRVKFLEDEKCPSFVEKKEEINRERR